MLIFAKRNKKTKMVHIIHVVRCAKYTKSVTMGKMFIDGEFICDTLERASSGTNKFTSIEKILLLKSKGFRAIGEGSYKLDLDLSDRFSSRAFYRGIGGLLPHVLGVKGFEGVRIHCGNSIKDTEGCILVGKKTTEGWISESRQTYKRLMIDYLLPWRKNKEEAIISIISD